MKPWLKDIPMTLQLELGRQGMRASTLICIEVLEAAVKIMSIMVSKS